MTVELRAALASLPPYIAGKSVKGAIKLSSNEMPYPPLPSVAAAITEAALATNRYPDPGATALAARLAASFGVDPDWIAIGCGSVALCHQLIGASCVPGDEVLYPWRSFEAYPILTSVVGATSVQVPLRGHEVDLDALLGAITERTRLIFLCSPNNPTGTVVPPADVRRFVAAVPGRVLIVLDQAYQEFLDRPAAAVSADGLDGTAPAADAGAGQDGIDLVRAHDNVVVLRTMSKAYGLAGLRVGYAVAQPQVAAAIRKVGVPFSVNAIAQAAALAALDSETELLDRCRQITVERTRVRDALLAAGFDVPPSGGNFVWLPLRDESAAFAAHCERARVLVRAFNDADNGGVRVTVATPADNDAFLACARSFGTAPLG